MTFNNILYLFILASFAWACGPSNTVNIDKKPIFPGDEIPLKELTSEVNQQVIRIGELSEIRHLDPLYATTNGEWRIIHLVYEGLVNLNADGTFSHGIANSWKISEDSLTYEFYLGNKRFHNADLFFNGHGREVTADDVVFAFNRMALATVPPHAARLFWAIQGMDSYFAEQHEIYDEDKRSLKHISGVSAPDAKTIVITLDYKDPLFLQKLARPEAVIYPKEAIQNGESLLKKAPVGTGEWKFSGLFQDSIITLRPVNQSTNISQEIKRRRIEVYFFKSEVALYKQFFKDEIDIVPELGPQLSASLLNTEGELEPAYREQFLLFNTTSTEPYTLWLNQENRYHFSESDVQALINSSQLEQSFSGSKSIESTSYLLQSTQQESNKLYVFTKPDAKARLTFTFNGDALAFEILRNVFKPLQSRYDVVAVKSFVSGRESIFTIQKGEERPSFQSIPVAKFFVKRTGLQKKNQEFATFSSEPWWISIQTD